MQAQHAIDLHSCVVPGTAPDVVHGTPHQLLLNGLAFQHHHGRQQPGLRLQHGGAVAPFPQSAAAPMAIVESAHVGTPYRLHELRQTFGGVRREQQMHLVGQQDERVQHHTAAPGHVAQQLFHARIVLPVHKNGLQVIAALYHVMRQAG
ncbi:hypothetical protein D3C72_1807570 [compost metagenome]